MNLILKNPIGIGHPLSQMQKVKPGFNPECLQEASSIGRILKCAPGKSAIAFALVSELLKGLKERRMLPGRDVVLDGHQDRPPVVLNILGKFWDWPVH
jgi:hypothetical protein